MRERLNHEEEIQKQEGITPAYAGKTIAVPLNGGHVEDHPRVCGKDLLL